jgi:hypothetical protein
MWRNFFQCVKVHKPWQILDTITHCMPPERLCIADMMWLGVSKYLRMQFENSYFSLPESSPVVWVCFRVRSRQTYIIVCTSSALPSIAILSWSMFAGGLCGFN